VVVAYTRYYLRIVLKGLRKTKKNLSQDRNNPAEITPTQSGALPLDQSVRYKILDCVEIKSVLFLYCKPMLYYSGIQPGVREDIFGGT
jgi:hypothetical protein